MSKKKQDSQGLQSLAPESLGTPQHPLVLLNLIKKVVGKYLRLVTVIKLGSNEILKGSLLSYYPAIIVTTLITVCCTVNVRNEIVERGLHFLNVSLPMLKNLLY